MKPTTAPVLSYPQLNKRLCAGNRCQCIHGLGAVLSQEGDDGLLHPVAYTSCSLSKSEANYSITQLEILTVVWAVMYFHCYLYGCSVTVFTDHSAVKVVLETPSPTGKLSVDGLLLLSLPRQSRQGRNSNSHSVEKASLHICQITKPHQPCWASISQSSRDEQPRELCRVCSECGWGTGYRCGHHGPSCDQLRKQHALVSKTTSPNGQWCMPSATRRVTGLSRSLWKK